MAQAKPLGHPLREHFLSGSNPNLNHGSFGTFPEEVRSTLNEYQRQLESQPDIFIRYTYPPLLDKARTATASLLNVPVEEVVFVPNATTGINTVLRGMKFENGDLIVHFETVYGAIEKTVDYIVETTMVESEAIGARWPIEDDTLVQRFEESIVKLNREGGGRRKVRLAIFDTIVSMPGVRVPFERLIAKCKELDVLSMVDGAHGIGHIPLDLGTLKPDFFVSNLHKWLFVPRGACVLHVPLANQHLIRSSLPTSWGFVPAPKTAPQSSHPRKPKEITSPLPASRQPPFIALFEYTATIDNTNYLCVPAALSFRSTICGGEDRIMSYCIHLALEGGNRAAEILGTDVMDNATHTMRNCAFAMVRLPLSIGAGKGMVREGDKAAVAQWMARRAAEECHTYFAVVLYGERWWWRVSAQVYLEVVDVEWGARKLKELCERVSSGEWLTEGKAE
ncbi:hypothetical protein MMC26_001525 [Xylographa opegraphella]|nr:hypothetical protein [Xylographa opegraphella]